MRRGKQISIFISVAANLIFYILAGALFFSAWTVGKHLVRAGQRFSGEPLQQHLETRSQGAPAEVGSFIIDAEGKDIGGIRTPWTLQEDLSTWDSLPTLLAACDLPEDAVLHARVTRSGHGRMEVTALKEDTVGSAEGCVRSALKAMPVHEGRLRGGAYAAQVYLVGKELRLPDRSLDDSIRCNFTLSQEQEDGGSRVELSESVAQRLWKQWAPRLACPSPVDMTRLEFSRSSGGDWMASQHINSFPDVPCAFEKATALANNLFADVQKAAGLAALPNRIYCELDLVLLQEVN